MAFSNSSMGWLRDDNPESRRLRGVKKCETEPLLQKLFSQLTGQPIPKVDFAEQTPEFDCTLMAKASVAIWLRKNGFTLCQTAAHMVGNSLTRGCDITNV